MTDVLATDSASHVWIFNVNRGLCILIRTPRNSHILYDLGASTDCDPVSLFSQIPSLKTRVRDGRTVYRVDQVILSHPHADHIANIKKLASGPDQEIDLGDMLITCPHDKPSGDGVSDERVKFSRIIRKGENDELIAKYRSLYDERKLPLRTMVTDDSVDVAVDFGLYYCRPPVVEAFHPSIDQDYGNGLSLVLWFKHGEQSCLIPGDITPAVFEHVVNDLAGVEKRWSTWSANKRESQPDWHLKTSDQQSLKGCLGTTGVRVLIAPHHGLESGFCPEVFYSARRKKAGLVVVADKTKTGQSGDTDARYSSPDFVSGQNVTIDGKSVPRRTVSTKRGHHLAIRFTGKDGAPQVWARNDFTDLVADVRSAVSS